MAFMMKKAAQCVERPFIFNNILDKISIASEDTYRCLANR
ncbi:hypothetical protein PPIS_a1655 [Pseudoalteromonas piscicida]|uniref:Uncharacterized protein n=1 Tax=Pseudoalteromonas piscicida TaxID=43662 RepID=A0ABM6NDD3_PSEO7|nr:hypothetical protein PPIS_a1655 [Pseudoalteromonas piscicida]